MKRESSHAPVARSLPVISATYLSGATLRLQLPRSEVEALVARVARRLGASPQLSLDGEAVPSACHPIIVDIWELNAGRLELGGLTQHEWSEVAYGTFGGLAGAALGAISGASRALLSGQSGSPAAAGPAWQQTLAAALHGGLGGMASGVTRFGRIGQTLSANSARVLGNYVEIMFSVPGVRLAATRTPTGPFALVLGVYTDSRPACAIDRSFRYGLQKTLATIELGTSGQTRLARSIDRGGRAVFSAALRERASIEQLTPGLACSLAAPLLGIHTDRARSQAAARWSCLYRNFTSGTVRGVEGKLELPVGAFGLPSGSWTFGVDSIGYDRVWSEITLPADPS